MVEKNQKAREKIAEADVIFEIDEDIGVGLALGGQEGLASIL